MFAKQVKIVEPLSVTLEGALCLLHYDSEAHLEYRPYNLQYQQTNKASVAVRTFVSIRWFYFAKAQ
jgi:hypothetical protein